MEGWVRGRAGDEPNTANAVLDPASFKHALPKTGRSKLGSRNGSHANSRSQVTGDAYDTDLGSAADTTTNLDDFPLEEPRNAQPIIVPSIDDDDDDDDDDNDDDGDQDSANGGQEDNDDGEDNGDDDDDDDDDDVLYWTEFGQEFSVSRKRDPAKYTEIKTKLIAHGRIAPADVYSYPDTTSGIPSTVSSEEQVPVSRQVESYDPAPPQQYATETTKTVPKDAPSQNQKARRGVEPSALASGTAHSQKLQRPGSARIPGLTLPPKRHLALGRPKSRQHMNGDVRAEVNQRNLTISSRMVEPGVVMTPTKTFGYRQPPAARHGYQTVDVDGFEHHGMPEYEQHSIVGGIAEPQQPVFDLDYDDEVLGTKDFEQIQAESYDVDPRSKARKVEKLTEDMLQEKLAGLVKAEPEQQREFFSSLNIDEWEQAGDWFLDKFSEVLANFKEKRRDKRKLSREFEAEIQARHEAVVQKRQTTDEALAAMKGAGVNLLETPKKMRSRR